MEIGLDDPRRADVLALLHEHLTEMRATSPPESVHALDAGALGDVAALEDEALAAALDAAEGGDRSGLALDEGVDPDDEVAVLEQPLDSVRTDVSGGAGDEDAHRAGLRGTGARRATRVWHPTVVTLARSVR